MALIFLGINNVPTYTALSSDIVGNKIIGCNLPGKIVFLTDTSEYKFTFPDLTLGDYFTGGSGNTNFTGLSDAPSSYAGQSAKLLAVKSTEDGLEFVTGGGGGGSAASSITNTPAGNISATNVQAAINELDTEKSSTSHAHAASTITSTAYGTVSATNVQAAIIELEVEKAALVHSHAATVITNTPAGNISSTTVQAAINELDTEKSSTSHIHAATVITNTPAGNIAATTVQDAINELDTEKSSTSHVHAASAITNAPSGNIAATNIQAAINELDSEKSSTSHTHTILNLTDTPSSYTGSANKVLAVKATEDGVEFITGGGGSGASEFIDLNDVPAAYTGNSGKVVAVKSAEDGLEFVNASGTSFSAYNDSLGDTFTNNTNDNVVGVDTELVDADGISSVAANVITLAAAGWYTININVDCYSETPFNGTGTLLVSGTGMGYESTKGYQTAWGITYDVFNINFLWHTVSPNTTFNIKFNNHLGSSVDSYCLEAAIYKR